MPIADFRTECTDAEEAAASARAGSGGVPIRSFTGDKRLRADFAWVLGGNILYSACQWGIVVALAKLGNAAQVGEYALGLAVAAPIVLFANLQLRALLASDLTGQFTFDEYLTFRLASLSAALIGVAGVAALTQHDWRLGGIIVLVGFAQALESVSDTYYGLMQKQERMDRVSTSLLLKGPLSLGALCVGMYVSGSVLWAVASLALGRLFILLIWDSRGGFAARPLPFAWNFTGSLTLLRTALPLGLISMLLALNQSIPRYFLQIHSGSAELGIFSAIASLLTAGGLVVAAFGQSIFLPVARACAAFDRARFRGYAALAMALGCALGASAVLAVAMFGRPILTHLFRPEYAEHSDIFVRLMIAGSITFIASGLGYVVTAARSLRPQIPLLIVTALAATATSAWSIPRYGLHGAADSALATASVQLIGMIAILLRIDQRLKRNAPGNLPKTTDPDFSAKAKTT
jgi:O-antigen/teichoic acid export membrane protein